MRFAKRFHILAAIAGFVAGVNSLSHADPKEREGGRPSEADIFGAPADAAANPTKPVQATGTASPPPNSSQTSVGPATTEADPRAAELAAPAHSFKDQFAAGTAVDNPLQIGGRYYQRLILSGQEGRGLTNAPLAAPLQFDGFLDGRPNDRLRGYINSRLSYDPTSTANASVALDQAWLKFDIDRAVFVTAGKQHVKWGTSRFWNPTDFLSNQRRDPLLPYDLRLGSGMVKFDLPMEASRSAIYAILLLDNPSAAGTAGKTGLALRGETTAGNTVMGLDFVFRGQRSPVYGADLTSPLGPFDIYAELAYQPRPSGSQYQLLAPPTAGADLSSFVLATPRTGSATQASGGLSYSFSWKENRVATAGIEYFYNALGYGDIGAYPVLYATGEFQPFFLGRHYFGLYLTAEGPDEAKRTSYTFTLLGNLSDHSYLGRIDFAWRVLTYLTFDIYLNGHFGQPGGEFRFAMQTPALTYSGTTIPAVNLPNAIFDLGLGLRLDF
ncbi:MAG: hypothetical protein AB7P04_00575 [Bacteriovoracia bacterium]